MSRVLERLRAQQKEEKPVDVSTVIADQYIADIKKKTYEQAHKDFTEALELIKHATEVERESYERQIDAMNVAHETTKTLLAKNEAEVSRLTNALNALNNEVKEFEVTIENLKNEQLSLMHERNKMELDHRKALSEVKPVAPIIQRMPFQFPEIEFTPTYGADGKTISVTAKPRTN